MSNSAIKIAALEKVANAWTGAGLGWAVTNGLEDYPSGIGRDLDVIVEKGSLKGAVQLVVDCLGACGWAVVPNRQGWIWWIVAFKESEDGSIDSLQIDLFEHLQWAFTWVAEGVGQDGGLVQRGPFVEDLGAGLAKRFLLHALSTGARAFKKRPAYLEMSEDELSLLPGILARVSGREWPGLVKAVSEGDLPELDRELLDFRKACYGHFLRSPGRGQRLASAFQKQWVVNLRPEQGAPVIEVSGCSSAEGNGEMLETLKRELENLVYQKVQVVEKGGEDSARSLRRLSCLQVVLIFVEARIPKGLRADLRVSRQGSDFKVELFSLNGDSTSRLFPIADLRKALMVYFQETSRTLIQKHQLRPLSQT